MPTIQSTVTVAANTTVEDILVNNVLAIQPRNAMLNIALVAAATGLICDVNVGTRQVAPSMIPSEANRVPIIPDDIQVRTPAMAGDRLIIRVRNTTGGGIRLNFTVIVQ